MSGANGGRSFFYLWLWAIRLPSVCYRFAIGKLLGLDGKRMAIAIARNGTLPSSRSALSARQSSFFSNFCYAIVHFSFRLVPLVEVVDLEGAVGSLVKKPNGEKSE